MHPVREITAAEENFRLEPQSGLPGIHFVRRDPVEPVPVGTLVMMAFRVTGYDRDCDGSLMARLEGIDCRGEASGWEPKNLGLYPDDTLVVTPEELASLFGVQPPRD